MAVLVVLCSGTASLQDQPDGTVAIGIDLSDGVDGSLRLYAERDTLDYSIPVGNESQVPIVVDQQVLRRLFAVQVELGGASVPVDVHWPDEVSVQDRNSHEVVTRFPAWQPVWLNPREAVWFKVTLARQGAQRFEEGQYDVAFTVSGFATAIRRGDGTPWRGVTNANGTWRRGPLIKRPANPQEQLAAHMADANLALGRGDREANLEALQKAATTAPGDRYVKVRLGLAYLGLRRYPEAISIYESLLAGAASVDPAAARDLAKAYIGIRDEGNAARVLRWGGIAESEVSTEISALRKALR